MKRQRSADCFSPDAIKNRLVKRQRVQDGLNAAFLGLQSLDIFSVTEKNLVIDENQALILLASKLTFGGVLRLKIALDHVPATFNIIHRGTNTPLRFSFVSDIVRKTGLELSPSDVQKYAGILEHCCPNFSSSVLGFDDCLWNLTGECNSRYNRFITPPVQSCLMCDDRLTMHNSPSKAIVYEATGPLPATKITLECRKCKTLYGICYFSDESGNHLYPEQFQSHLVEASNVTYMDKNLYKWIPSLGNHCWVSFSGFSEAYDEVFSVEIERFQQYVKDKESASDDEDDIHEYAEDSHENSAGVETDTTNADKKNPLQKVNIPGDLTSKIVAKCFWKHELNEELQDLGLANKWVFCQEKGDMKGTQVDAMEHVEKVRCEMIYSHECSASCKDKGCGVLYVADGNWKLKYAHCMWNVPVFVDGFDRPINYPSICPLSPERGKAFCKQHCDDACKGGVPTGLHDFLQYCGVRSSGSGSDLSSLTRGTVDEKIKQALNSVTKESPVVYGAEANASTFQGTSKFIMENGSILVRESSLPATDCNKDTGGRKTLQSWSRGIFFVVSAGGQIEYWQPLYRSESPTQAFLVLILWMYRKFKPLLDSGLPSDQILEHMSHTIVAYDNMCHVDGLKVSKCELPFPNPLNKMWLNVVKVIDRLHIRNHKDAKCKTHYNPDGKIPPQYNTMAAEQTNVWASRLKRILCAMPRLHQFFYLHRAVKRRNLYTQRCHLNKKLPLLPKQNKEWVADAK